jgi:hypothetical protein
MTTRIKFLLVIMLALCLLLGATGPVRAARSSQASAAQAIGWWVLGSGGGPSSGSTITLDGTLGQPVVGVSTNGVTTLSAGYWFAGHVSGNATFLPLIMR